VAPDGKTVYVANSQSNTVSVISAATGTVTQTIRVGAQPNGIIVAPDGKTVYVANETAGTVSVIRTGSVKTG